jgi:hypothetical protein
MRPPRPPELTGDTTRYLRTLALRCAAARPRGEPIASLMAGVLSLVLGFFSVAAFSDLAPPSLPGLVHRATIVVGGDPIMPRRIGDGVYRQRAYPGWWNVPEAGLFRLIAIGLTLACLGLLLSRGKGRPFTSAMGFGVNAAALMAAYALLFTDFREW